MDKKVFSLDDGVFVTTNVDMSKEEARAYVDRALSYYGKPLSSVHIDVDGEFVDLHYTFKAEYPFERIRRITGYLVGSVNRFNNAKKAEEHDRVKHSGIPGPLDK